MTEWNEAIEAAAKMAAEHDSTPDISPADDPIAHANQAGYRTARDQIVGSIREMKR